MNNGKKCAIIGAMQIPLHFKEKLQECNYIICADGGASNAKLLGLHINLAVGDWDSTNLKDVVADEIITLPKEKNDTDMHFAAHCAVKMGFKEVQILGGIGGRIDHTFANINTLRFLADEGVYAYMENDESFFTVLKNSTMQIKKRANTYLSIFPLDEKCEGVTLTGLKYPLTNAVLKGNFPVGVSNEFSDEVATISIKKGTVLIMIVKKD